MGSRKISFIHKNFIKLFSLTVFVLCCVSKPVFSYEVVEAETVAKPVNNPLYGQLDKSTSYVRAKKKEMYIPNPLDEFILKRIKESNANTKPAPKTKKEDLSIESKELEYFDETGELEARGHVLINSSSGTTVTSDRALYDKNANIIKLFDNVVVKQGDNVVNGEYMVIDLNEENALIEKPVASVGPLIRLRAEEGYVYTDRIEAVNGSAELAKKVEMCLESSGFESYDRMLISDEDVSFDIKRQRLSPYKIKAKEIIIESKKDHDTFTIKNADLYYKKMKLVTVGSLELFSDKEMNYVEANVPVEIGSISDFGQYAGLGYIFKLPNGGNLKAAPAIVYDDDEIGLGVFAGLKTKRLDVNAAWATSSQNLILNGRYEFNDNLRAEFGRHSYQDEWFLGSKRPGHLAQLVYDNDYFVEDLNATFRHRITAGYVSDYVEHRQEDNNYGTMRFRWQAEISKPVFTVSNKEQDLALELGVSGQTMATVYGTGETVGIARGGPYINSRVKNWRSNISYNIGGVHGQSPFEFDEYTYGRSAIGIEESLRLCRYLSIGYRGVISPLKDNSDDDLLTENRLYAIVGPDDFKFAVSYDTVRQNAHLDFMFLLGTDTSDITYEKMTVKNPQSIGKKETGIFKDRNYYKIKVPENL